MLRHQNISQVCFLCSSLTCQIALQILILPHNVKEFKQLLMFEPWVEKVNAKNLFSLEQSLCFCMLS